MASAIDDQAMTRVAALQFASGTDVNENLQTCLRMIEKAASYQPQLMVLPEFSNHISWYDDADHAREVSLGLDGAFLAAISAAAAQHRCHLVINVSLRRLQHLTITSLMYGPDGQLLAEADKQTLMGHENIWFQRASRLSPVVETALGKLAMFPCRDGVTFETPRGLALRGAQLFCDSLNSFALDEASLHVPARAPENHCFLVAANKVGPLIPEALLQSVSEETHIPLEFLYGAGESQIVGPDGQVLARGPRHDEAVVWADVDLSQAKHKYRADGTDSFASRRPALYGAIATKPVARTAPIAEVLDVACLNPVDRGNGALDALQRSIADLPKDVRIAVLPELYGQKWSSAADAETWVGELASVCASHGDLMLVTSVPLALEEGVSLAAVLIAGEGIVFRQPQLHESSRFPGLVPGSELATHDTRWGRVALLTADDMRYPELAKLAAIEGVQLLLVPGHLQAEWEAQFALPSRAAENRLCLAYACTDFGGAAGMLANLTSDFTLMEPWQDRSFDGFINQPLITRQDCSAAFISARLNLPAADNKLMSAQTDLILDRPWQLSQTLVEELDHG